MMMVEEARVGRDMMYSPGGGAVGGAVGVVGGGVALEKGEGAAAAEEAEGEEEEDGIGGKEGGVARSQDVPLEKYSEAGASVREEM